MEVIIYLSHWSKGMWAERVAHSTSLTFLLLLLVHHIFSRDYQEFSLASIHPHIHTLLLLWNGEIHTKPAPRFPDIPYPFPWYLWLSWRDASIKSSARGTGIYFCRYPQLRIRKKMPDEKAHELHPRIPFPLLSYFLLCLLYVCSFNHCAIKTYVQHVAIYMQLNGWWLWDQMNNFSVRYTVEPV